jgi:hypothetical protein
MSEIPEIQAIGQIDLSIAAVPAIRDPHITDIAALYQPQSR